MGIDYVDPDPEPIEAIASGTVYLRRPKGGGWQPNRDHRRSVGIDRLGLLHD
jgi:hypothetical protein